MSLLNKSCLPGSISIPLPQIASVIVDEAMRQVESVLVCESRNLYDALEKIESSGLHLEEKRTAIEVLSIRERTKAAGVLLRWVDSHKQLAFQKWRRRTVAAHL